MQLLVYMLLLCVFQASSTPPVFVHQPHLADQMYFISNSDNSVLHPLKDNILKCQATGSEQIKYKWFKNGVEDDLRESVNAQRIELFPNEGSIMIKSLKDEDQGVYQCHASNNFGTAVDKPIEIKRAFMGMFIDSPTKAILQNFGESFVGYCHPPRSSPEARVFWLLKTSSENSPHIQFRSINATNVITTINGTLIFQYIDGSEIDPQLRYTCAAENIVLKDFRFGQQFDFRIDKKASTTAVQETNYTRLYFSPDDVAILHKQTLELFCVVGGMYSLNWFLLSYLFPSFLPPFVPSCFIPRILKNPTLRDLFKRLADNYGPGLTPEWSKNGYDIDPSRVNFGNNFNKSMKIIDVNVGDGGLYSCKFPHHPAFNKNFSVNIEAAPAWLEETKSMNTTENSTVMFQCNAIGRPDPTFLFYKNGKEISSSTDTSISIEANRLTIKKVRKGSQERDGHMATYQCKATNKHGYLWTNFYLNVL